MDPHFREDVRALGERARDLRESVESAVRELPSTASELGKYLKAAKDEAPSMLEKFGARLKAGVLANPVDAATVTDAGIGVGAVIALRELILAETISPETENRIEQVKAENNVKKEMERRGYEYSPPLPR